MALHFPLMAREPRGRDRPQLRRGREGESAAGAEVEGALERQVPAGLDEGS